MQRLFLSEHNIFLFILAKTFTGINKIVFGYTKFSGTKENTLLSFELFDCIRDDITVLPTNIRYETAVLRKNKQWIIRFFCGLVGRTKRQNPYSYTLFRYVINLV
jgi:hypothetical protein